ncbi:hypothetical protein L6164_034248 [Bauhinia variegata]|uniref:Uncharacterized protein n=1 Tax=Bauhinia variegata TaxID=167791 RepID=A0ACB9KU85_BAUVA|nr:hypothetical protein L6164_034248 [Bauhinia variegata]
MANPMVAGPPSDLSFDDFSVEFNNLPVPSMDSLFFDNNNDTVPSDAFASDLELGMEFGESGDFEITFDDLDNLYIPSDAEDFLLPDGYNPTAASILPSGSTMDHPVEVKDGGAKHMNNNVASSESTESGASAVSGSRSSDVARLLNSRSSDSASCKREHSPPVSLDDSGDQNHNLDDVKFSSFESPESDSCDRESSGGQASSQGSGNAGSGVYEVMDSPSPDRDISSHAVVDRDIKLEELGKNCELKRKKEQNEGNADSRTAKYQRSSVPLEFATQQSGLSGINGINDEDEKRNARLMRNRESAQLSRQRKKHYVEELEEKVRSMHSTITELSGKISFVVAENATLRQQLSAGGMCPTPPPGMYPPPPMAPMPYPWMPCAPYVMKPQGSQVPLVPIPRLKSQQPVSASKTKKSDSKRTEGKTKKVPTISFLGLFFFIFLFGGLVPLVNVKFGGVVDDVPSRPTYVSDKVYGQHAGKVWHLNGHTNGSEGDKTVGFSSGRFGSDRINIDKGRKLEETHKQRDPQLRSGSDEFVHLDNSSEPLLASLYVPRNNKLVKIDGNLIIHSILASEKAVASQSAPTKKDKRETGLSISKDWDSALAIPEVGGNRGRHAQLYRSPPEQRKALASGSAETLKDHLKSTAADGTMQQWFREGLAGPMLSSGMCTEVFQFDASPKPGAIVPASSVANVSSENHQNQNGTSSNKNRNRRILHKLPDSLARSGLNISHNDNFHGNKSTSSMVVSVLVDPKEAGDGDVDDMITPKSLSRIFVVVLIDSVKYVTYSCGLPRASPHLVAA